MGLLESACAVVTGGASGIGLAVCRRFAAEGAAVAVLDIDGEGAQAAAKEIGGLAYPVDVSDAPRVEQVIRDAAAQLGGLSILSNNAGAGQLGPFHEYSPEDIDRLIRVNLLGVSYAMRTAIPLMLAGGGGAIVNNASGSGLRPTRGELPYSAAKAGVIALTQGAAQEYGPQIRVNCVSPGVIRTPMSEALFRMPKLLEPVRRATPLGRTGTPEEVADAVLFLCSDLSRFVTGQNLLIDGGLGLPQAGIDETLKSLLERMQSGGGRKRQS